MKKHAILVSMIVATMFATSCSKDDGDNVEQPVTQEVQNEDNNKSEAQNAESRQIVIKADNGKILSEVETTDGYDFTFSKGDKLVLTDGETTYATLEMGYTFSTDYGSVFFPAAGLRGGNNAGNGGYYWSSSPVYDDANFLYFGDGEAHVNTYLVDSKFSVRLVREL